MIDHAAEYEHMAASDARWARWLARKWAMCTRYACEQPGDAAYFREQAEGFRASLRRSIANVHRWRYEAELARKREVPEDWWSAELIDEIDGEVFVVVACSDECRGRALRWEKGARLDLARAPAEVPDGR